MELHRICLVEKGYSGKFWSKSKFYSTPNHDVTNVFLHLVKILDSVSNSVFFICMMSRFSWSTSSSWCRQGELSEGTTLDLFSQGKAQCWMKQSLPIYHLIKLHHRHNLSRNNDHQKIPIHNNQLISSSQTLSSVFNWGKDLERF